MMSEGIARLAANHRGVVLTMMADEGEARIKASFGSNYARLAALKAKFDPHNLFRVNQNIRPAN